MDFYTEIIPSCKILYMRNVGPYGVNNVQTMEKLKSWANHNELLCEESVILGIARDNPIVTPPEACRYDACLVLDKDYHLQDTILQMDVLPGGNYAILVIEHTATGLQNAWDHFFPELQNHNLTIDQSRPIIERYTEKMLQNHLCELCVPVN